MSLRDMAENIIEIVFICLVCEKKVVVGDTTTYHFVFMNKEDEEFESFDGQPIKAFQYSIDNDDKECRSLKVTSHSSLGDICLIALDKLGENFCVHCALGDIVEGMSLLDRYQYTKDIEEDNVH